MKMADEGTWWWILRGGGGGGIGVGGGFELGVMGTNGIKSVIPGTTFGSLMWDNKLSSRNNTRSPCMKGDSKAG
jgi:hypothetical protein